MLKTKSIKKDLIITTFALIACALIAVNLISFFNTKKQVQEAFDANLVKSAKLSLALVEDEVETRASRHLKSKNIHHYLKYKIFHHYEYQLHSQVWKGDELIYKSDDVLNLPKPDYEGFKNVEGDWRSFALYDKESAVTILVVEEYRIRSDVVFKILLSLSIPLLFSFILLLIIIISTVNRKLKPLESLSDNIERMSAKTLQKLSNDDIPIELRAFTNSFNSLIERLTKSMELEQNFANYAAHELKTPLAAISAQTYLLINNNDKNKSKEYAQDLLDGVNRANHLISQLLTLVRLDSDNKIHTEKLDLKEIAQAVIKNYEKNLEIEVISNLEKSELLIELNKIYIEILIGNLVDNAIKYSIEGKKIIIDIFKENNFLIFKISNFGEEIFESEIENVFNNFYRINRLKSQRDKVGSGLGLAIVKRIAEIHFAEISFKSQNNINSVEVKFPANI